MLDNITVFLVLSATVRHRDVLRHMSKIVLPKWWHRKPLTFKTFDQMRPLTSIRVAGNVEGKSFQGMQVL